MAKRKKIKRLDAVQMVKEMARDRIGAPPLPRVVPDKKKGKGRKHKVKLEEILSDDGA